MCSYYNCVECPRLGKECAGPNPLYMEMEDFVGWCKERKNFLGWTNREIAERSDISIPTIDRLMAGNINDLRFSTVRLVMQALVGDPNLPLCPPERRIPGAVEELLDLIIAKEYKKESAFSLFRRSVTLMRKL